jgi:hypothetical protein
LSGADVNAAIGWSRPIIRSSDAPAITLFVFGRSASVRSERERNDTLSISRLGLHSHDIAGTGAMRPQNVARSLISLRRFSSCRFREVAGGGGWI